jgi:hypothetical protein
VEGDAGYRFDDYGPGKRLDVGLLPAHALTGWGLYFPLASSRDEGGARRGCCVLSSPALTEVVDGLSTLRSAKNGLPQ